MRAANLLSYGLGVLGLLTLGLVSGCGSVSMKTSPVSPVFFPPPPEQPRLQFLKSFSTLSDLGAPGPSGFERFVLGEPQQREGIATPYGLAVFDDKIYVCDVGKRRIDVLDLRRRSFGYMTEDRRLMNPVNLCIEPDGTKYVADPAAGAVFVFDAADTLQAILGKELQISPIDVAVRGNDCYVTDFRSNQVVVLDKATGREIRRIGEAGDGDDQFKMISDLTFGPDGDLYVTDRLKAKVFQFDPSGKLKRTIGQRGANIQELVRPKGIAVDREKRIWLVDAGVGVSETPSVWSTEVAKIYDDEGRLLLFFGSPGNKPGMMNMPAKIILDYDHVDLFRQYAVKGANIEFLVLVSNQYGPNKVSVYGFGEFPRQATPGMVAPAPAKQSEETPTVARAEEPPAAPAEKPPVASPEKPPAKPAVGPAVETAHPMQLQDVVELYHRSMTQYDAGELAPARTGFVKVIESGIISPQMVETLRGYIADIDARLKSGPVVTPKAPPQTPPAPPVDPQVQAARVQQQIREIAELYRQSVALYNAGDLTRARAGFLKALESGLLPPQMEERLRGTIKEIDAKLGGSPDGSR